MQNTKFKRITLITHYFTLIKLMIKFSLILFTSTSFVSILFFWFSSKSTKISQINCFFFSFQHVYISNEKIVYNIMFPIWCSEIQRRIPFLRQMPKKERKNFFWFLHNSPKWPFVISKSMMLTKSYFIPLKVSYTWIQLSINNRMTIGLIMPRKVTCVNI